MTKQQLRDHLARLPFDEKLEILDRLRERALTIAEVREALKQRLSESQ